MHSWLFNRLSQVNTDFSGRVSLSASSVSAADLVVDRTYTLTVSYRNVDATLGVLATDDGPASIQASA